MSTAAPEILEDCIGLCFLALREFRNGHLDKAKQALGAALVTAVEIPEDLRNGFRAAPFYCILLIQSRQSPGSVTPELRSKASTLLDQSQTCDSVDSFQHLMFDVLIELGEQRRAIAFGERALAVAVESKESVRTADLLWRIGGCYSRIGLRDHAAIAYRGALRFFRNETADPRLPVVLLALGNAVRKSAPSEAEGLYKEAAALWEKKGQFESATPAWTNLAIVCSDQGRFEEAINYYERVRRVRESSPGTPLVRIGTLYNNMASCYRKMARFADAHQAIERAIDILAKPGALGPNDGNSLASSLGTKGMILRDEGRHLEAVDWFRRARTEFENQPSPNLESVIEELEYEAAALSHLNRTDEARAVEEQIKVVRKTAAEIPSFNRDDYADVKLTEGAVLVELEGGLRAKSTEEKIAKLGSCLHKILEEQNLGDWQGLIRIPECSTLIYYGPNAEAMYRALEPSLVGDPQFEGALITIRQGSQQREVSVPRRMVN
jgi:tetratricopeptide (TPR) repeat protein